MIKLVLDNRKKTLEGIANTLNNLGEKISEKVEISGHKKITTEISIGNSNAFELKGDYKIEIRKVDGKYILGLKDKNQAYSLKLRVAPVNLNPAEWFVGKTNNTYKEKKNCLAANFNEGIIIIS